MDMGRGGGPDHRAAGEDRRVSDGGRASWDEHWRTIAPETSIFGRIVSLVRRQLLSRATRSYAERYFPRDGVFVEMGCGTAQSSGRIPTRERQLVALDFSARALREARAARVFGALVQADIERIPFAGSSLSGIWNLGVMEHFEAERGVRILKEFRRVLKPGGCAVLFWPPEFGSSRMVLAPLEWFRSQRSGRPFRFFPDEVNRLRSKAHARRLLAAAGLEPVALDFSARAAFIHLVTVARRPFE
jgi:SAM-dependent methyltransferase